MDYQPEHIRAFAAVIDFYRDIPECSSPMSVSVPVRGHNMDALQQLREHGDIEFEPAFSQSTRKLYRLFKLTPQGLESAVRLVSARIL